MAQQYPVMLRVAIILVCLLLAVAGCGVAPESTGQAGETSASASVSSTVSSAPSPSIVPTTQPTATSVPSQSIETTETSIATTDAPQQGAIQGQVAFVREGNIWLLDVKTRQERQLTSDGMSSAPTWSPDGETLVFVREQGENTEIMQIAVDGSAAKSLTGSDNIKLVPSYDRDGKLYFVRRVLDGTPDNEIVRLEPDGTEALVHSEPGGLCGPTGLSVFDETRIALSLNCGRGSYVFLVNAQTKSLIDVVETYGEPGYCANTAVWADEGQRIAVVTAKECSGQQNSNIALLDMSSSAPKLQTVYTSERIGSLALAPDGQALVFERWILAETPVYELWLLDLRGSAVEPQLLIENGGSPAWRPKR